MCSKFEMRSLTSGHTQLVTHREDLTVVISNKYLIRTFFCLCLLMSGGAFEWQFWLFMWRGRWGTSDGGRSSGDALVTQATKDCTTDVLCWQRCKLVSCTTLKEMCYFLAKQDLWVMPVDFLVTNSRFIVLEQKEERGVMQFLKGGHYFKYFPTKRVINTCVSNGYYLRKYKRMSKITRFEIQARDMYPPHT